MLQPDTYQHKGLRLRLISELRKKGITDERVLEAMNLVPRHFFFDSCFLKFAYIDKAFPIEAGQTISQPYTVAFQTQLLQVQKMEKILEVGTGSGYQTAILAKMGARVYSIERQRELFLRAKKMLDELGVNPYTFYGDGYNGVPVYAPYNKIIVTAGAPEIPKALLDQLALNGRMVIPVGEKNQIMTLVEKLGPDSYKTSTFGNFTFVPMLTGKS